MTAGGPELAAPGAVAELAASFAAAWGAWSPSLSRDGRHVAYVSDRRGVPELWVQPAGDGGPATAVTLSPDPVLAVRWSPDGEWLACSVASGGGVRSEVWVVRPDGADGRLIAGSPGHAVLGPWARHGHRLALTVADLGHEAQSNCLLVDAATGETEVLASGRWVEALDLSPDERFLLTREGPRGAHVCRLIDRRRSRTLDVLPYPSLGSTEFGLLRRSPAGTPDGSVAYLATDAGQARQALVAVPFGPDGTRGEAGALGQRDDAELEFLDGDQTGSRVLLGWNHQGRSQLELLETADRACRRFGDLPGSVLTGICLARDGRTAVVAVEGHDSPSRLWQLTVEGGTWRPLLPRPSGTPALRAPSLQRLESHDGLMLSGWLYRPEHPVPSPPAVVSLHGGPESQERPGFHPLHQLLVAAGITVFAPNIRGSSGYGRTFVHADDRYGRMDAIGDVAACARWLVDQGIAGADRIAVAGRSYGGYASLMALVHFPSVFAAGVDICGMSDLATFFRDTEPWIARAAVTKYGDPARDAALLASVSPIHMAGRVTAPVLVVHGELDTNVPVSEGRAIVSTLQALGRPVEYLELPGEGHEYRHVSSRRVVMETVCRFLSRALGVPGGGDTD